MYKYTSTKVMHLYSYLMYRLLKQNDFVLTCDVFSVALHGQQLGFRWVHCIYCSRAVIDLEGQHGKTTYTACIHTDLDSRIQLAEVHEVCLFIHACTLIMYFAQELSDSGVLNGIPFASTARSGHLYKIENAPLFHPCLNTCGSHLVQVIERMYIECGDVQWKQKRCRWGFHQCTV